MTRPTANSKRSAAIEDNVTKKSKMEEIDATECVMRKILLIGSRAVALPNISLKFRLYAKENMLYTVFTLSINKTIVTKDYANGKEGTFSFIVNVDPMFLLLDYCRLSRSNKIDLKVLSDEFGFNLELESILYPCLENCPFILDGKFMVCGAKDWLKRKIDKMKVNNEMKAMAIGIFVHESIAVNCQ